MSIVDRVKEMFGQNTDKAKDAVHEADDVIDEETDGGYDEETDLGYDDKYDKPDTAQDKGRIFIDGLRPDDPPSS